TAETMTRTERAGLSTARSPITTESSMPRPRTGSVYPHGDHFDIRITLPDGTRSRPRCMPPEMSEAAARDRAQYLTDLAAQEALPGLDRKHAPKEPKAPPAETFETWIKRWYTAREERGLTSVKDDRGRITKWILPTLGPRPMTEITRRELEQI